MAWEGGTEGYVGVAWDGGTEGYVWVALEDGAVGAPRYAYGLASYVPASGVLEGTWVGL